MKLEEYSVQQLRDKYKYVPETGEIFYLTHGKETPCRNQNGDGYLMVNLDHKLVAAHRLIWKLVNGDIPEGMVIDHINNVRHDNRINNLRLATRTQNSQNRKKSSWRQYKGTASLTSPSGEVTYYASLGGESWGSFKTELQAAKSYDRKAIETYKEFASTNFPIAIYEKDFDYPDKYIPKEYQTLEVREFSNTNPSFSGSNIEEYGSLEIKRWCIPVVPLDEEGHRDFSKATFLVSPQYIKDFPEHVKNLKKENVKLDFSKKKKLRPNLDLEKISGSGKMVLYEGQPKNGLKQQLDLVDKLLQEGAYKEFVNDHCKKIDDKIAANAQRFIEHLKADPKNLQQYKNKLIVNHLLLK